MREELAETKEMEKIGSPSGHGSRDLIHCKQIALATAQTLNQSFVFLNMRWSLLNPMEWRMLRKYVHRDSWWKNIELTEMYRDKDLL